MNHDTSSSKHRLFHTGALSLLVSTGLLTAACGGGDTSGSGGATTTSSGGSTSTTTSDTGGGGSGGTGGAGGMAVNPDPCDPIHNDCVEAEASKCTLTLDAEQFATPMCAPPVGDAQLGEDCERPDNQPGHDTCAAGLYCGKYPKPKADPQTRACMTLCDPSNPCSADQTCIFLTTNPYGLCAEKCEPFTGSCGADSTRACELLRTVDGDPTFLCGPPGSKKADEACKFFDGCEANHVCKDGACHPICDDAHLCGAPDDACLLFYGSPVTSAFGQCAHPDDSCLGSVVWGLPMNAEETVSVTLLDYGTGAPLPGAVVKACPKNDAMCAAPLGQASADANGTATVTVPTVGAGFDGYFELSAPGFLPVLLYLNQPIASPQPFWFTMVTKEMMEGAFVGTPVADLSRGMIGASALDCAYNPQGGAVFSIGTADASTVLGHGLPRANAETFVPDTVDPALTSSQAGAFTALNVPVGKTNISVKTLDGQAIADLDVWSRAGGLTFAILLPAP